ncbi:MAG: hypothetical protein JXR73_04710 [Candidatus Omnitrophica bacterium]|nr:hypothetical protein [Candidatus Omnitrophota bacterium]
MKPIVLIHGFSAESRKTDRESIGGIYGDLPGKLQSLNGSGGVVEIDLSRYISLEDGVTIDDVSHALNRALETDFARLRQSGFHAVVHSAGALVIRNWIRRFSRKPSPIQNLVYLAGAHFGSGWAHLGRGQMARWGRFVFEHGAERGVPFLKALELGSNWTIDLHRFFLADGARMAEDYKIFEYVIVGSQADAAWYTFPIRYAKEDGSDGVVRVSSANLNFHYIRFGLKPDVSSIQWEEASRQHSKLVKGRGNREAFYEVKERSQPGKDGRDVIPFSIPFECAHSGKDMGVASGEKTHAQVLPLIESALKVRTKAQWRKQVGEFQAQTDITYQKARTDLKPGLFSRPREQYDPHAQIVFRIFDQDRRPVNHFDIFFEPSKANRASIGDKKIVQSLFEDKHINRDSPNTIVFYWRTRHFDEEINDWASTTEQLDGCFLDVTGLESATQEILYLPMRFQFSRSQLLEWVQDHRTTVIDVELFRLPSPGIYTLTTY